jgi:hypothetical protein
MVGKVLLYLGLAMIVAAAVKATLDMLRADAFDPWSVVLAVGCILASIGIGLTKSTPWKWIEETTSRLGQPPAQEK